MPPTAAGGSSRRWSAGCRWPSGSDGSSARPTGCGRFAASCDSATGFIQPILAIVLLVGLLLVPRLSAIAAAGAVAALMAAVPTALILSATGEAADAASRASFLGVVIVAGWAAGVGFAIVRRARSMPPRAGPVS